MNSLIKCSNIFVKQTSTKGLGAFAGKKIFKNEIIETGIMRRINTNGNEHPYLSESEMEELF